MTGSWLKRVLDSPAFWIALTCGLALTAFAMLRHEPEQSLGLIFGSLAGWAAVPSAVAAVGLPRRRQPAVAAPVWPPAGG